MPPQAAAPGRRLLCTAPTPAPLPLPCPQCGETCVVIHPDCFGEEGAFECRECKWEGSFDRMRRLVNVWARVLDWLAQAPACDDLGEDGLPADGEGA